MWLPCNFGECRYGNFRFKPTGKLVLDGREISRNPRRYEVSGDKYAVRLFVGLNVDNKPTWTLEDVMRLTKKIRLEQTGNVAASFVGQKGYYQMVEDKKVIEEDSVQVILFFEPVKDREETPEQFWDHATRLAEILCVVLDQQTILVEFQKNGLTQKLEGWQG